MGAQAARFRDPTSYYSMYNLAREPIDVECPRCTAHARVVVTGGDDDSPMTAPRRLVCPACGLARDWRAPHRRSLWGAARDPFFLQPLWLTATVRGHRLWAYNGAHLGLLAEFVTAGLRERGPYGGCSMSMIERLPAWLKSARHRGDVLAAVSRLRARLDHPGRPVAVRRHTLVRAAGLGRCGVAEVR